MPLNVEHVRAICFDVDGTLSDTDDVFVSKFARILKPFHFLFPRRDVQKAARRLVMAIEAPANFVMGIPDILGLDGPAAWLYDRISRLIGHHPKKTFLLVDGVDVMLRELASRFPLAVVSVRDERSTRAFLEQYHLLPYFTCIATGQTCKHTKPFPDPVLWAAEKMGQPPENCLMVGDTTVDMRAGRSAGTQTIGVLCGFGEDPELRRSGADMVLFTTADLLHVLEK